MFENMLLESSPHIPGANELKSSDEVPMDHGAGLPWKSRSSIIREQIEPHTR